jgi:hypothetical protein
VASVRRQPHHAIPGDHLGTLRRIAELLSLSFDDLPQ